MGWTASYQLLRETPLSKEEIAAIAQLNQDAGAEPWEGERFSISVAPDARPDTVLAAGGLKFPLGESEDQERLEEVLERLLALVPGAELRVVDDFGWFHPGKRQPKWIPVAYDELVNPAALAPPPLPALADGAELVAAELAGQAPVVTARREIEALYQAMIALEAVSREVAGAQEQKAAIEKLLDRGAAETVALVGLARYPELFTYYGPRTALGRALDRVEDFAPLIAPFLDAWLRGGGVYYYGDLPLPDRFRDALAARPEVRQQMLEDLRESERAPNDDLWQRRGQIAVDFLMRSGHDDALAAVLDLIARWRDKPRPFAFDFGVWSAAHLQLAHRGDGRAFATLGLYLSAMKSPTRAHDAALAALVRIDASRAAPLVKQLAAAELLLPIVVGLLPEIGDADAVAQLHHLAAFPSNDLRERARQGLATLGVDAGPPAALPPAEELLLHANDEVRSRALGEVHRRRDPALTLSLAAVAAVDELLRARTSRPALPFSWTGWDDRLPAQVSHLRPELLLAWAIAHAEETFGAQTILPGVATVLAAGAAASAESVPRIAWTLTDAEAGLLRSEENRTIFQLNRAAYF